MAAREMAQGDRDRRRRRKPVETLPVLFAVLGAVIILFISLPIASLLFSEPPDVLWRTFSRQDVQSAIGVSVLSALYSTLLALLFGVPLAYLLARFEFWGKEFVQSIVDVPVVIPHTVSGLALLTVFGTHGLLGRPLSQAGLQFSEAMPGIVIAMLFVSAPFVINAARNAFEAVDPRLENVARSLGATRAQAFFRVTIPLSARPILSGSLLSWARAISEFGAVIVLAYYPMAAPTLIYFEFTRFGIVASRPIAVVLILICLAAFLILYYTSRRKKKVQGLRRVVRPWKIWWR